MILLCMNYIKLKRKFGQKVGLWLMKHNHVIEIVLHQNYLQISLASGIMCDVL